jgi:hypothetical protein
MFMLALFILAYKYHRTDVHDSRARYLSIRNLAAVAQCAGEVASKQPNDGVRTFGPYVASARKGRNQND